MECKDYSLKFREAETEPCTDASKATGDILTVSFNEDYVLDANQMSNCVKIRYGGADHYLRF